MISLEFLAIFAMLTGNLEIKIGLAIEVEHVFVGYHYWKKAERLYDLETRILRK